MQRPAGFCWCAVNSSLHRRLVWWPGPLLALQAVPGAGIYPGVSNVMAAHMVSTARREYDSEGRWVGQQSSNGSEAVEPKSVRYYYYTAGTGGIECPAVPPCRPAFPCCIEPAGHPCQHQLEWYLAASDLASLHGDSWLCIRSACLAGACMVCQKAASGFSIANLCHPPAATPERY